MSKLRKGTRLFREFLIVDAVCFVLTSVFFWAIGIPELVPGVAMGYYLGFQTGSENPHA